MTQTSTATQVAQEVATLEALIAAGTGTATRALQERRVNAAKARHRNA